MHTHKEARACLGFQPGVRDFRGEAGAHNMIAKFKLDLLGMARHASHFSAGSVTFVAKPGPII